MTLDRLVVSIPHCQPTLPTALTPPEADVQMQLSSKHKRDGQNGVEPGRHTADDVEVKPEKSTLNTTPADTIVSIRRLQVAVDKDPLLMAQMGLHTLSLTLTAKQQHSRINIDCSWLAAAPRQATNQPGHPSVRCGDVHNCPTSYLPLLPT